MGNPNHPNTLAELIAVAPGVGRFRALSSSQLRCLLCRERGQCTWCGDPVTKGRSTWCSDRCVDEFKARCDPGVAARLAAERDQGVCRACGVDCLKVQRVFRHFHKFARMAWPDFRDRQFQVARINEVSEFLGVSQTGQPFEIDHIRPVVMGGGLCGPAGLRTLCLPCHRVATARLRKQMARRRAEILGKTKGLT